LQELKTTFRYNDAVIRSVVFGCNEAVTEESYIAQADKSERSERRERSIPPILRNQLLSEVQDKNTNSDSVEATTSLTETISAEAEENKFQENQMSLQI
jgi:small subunit ribosomal protein S6